jgi:hypothetical protein
MSYMNELFRKVSSAAAYRVVYSINAEDMHRDVLPCLNLTWLSWPLFKMSPGSKFYQLIETKTTLGY